MFRRPACTIEGTWPGEAESGGDGAQTAGAAAWEENGSFSRASYNPVGSYVKVFDLEPALRGKPVKICFEGVEQAMYLWLNGRFIGYAEDSFTPSEFDLTPYIRERGNVLAVEVHKRSTASYLEDQDFFRFFGIFMPGPACMWKICGPNPGFWGIIPRAAWNWNCGLRPGGMRRKPFRRPCLPPTG